MRMCEPAHPACLPAPCRSSAECRRALRRYRQRGLPLERVTVSTDAYGSLPRFDERGRLVEYGAASPGEGALPCGDLAPESRACTGERCQLRLPAHASLLQPGRMQRSFLVCFPSSSLDALLAFIRAMVGEEGWALEEVLPLAAANPARLLRLEGKGRLAVGADADVLLLEVRALVGGGYVGRTSGGRSCGRSAATAALAARPACRRRCSGCQRCCAYPAVSLPTPPYFTPYLCPAALQPGAALRDRGGRGGEDPGVGARRHV